MSNLFFLNGEFLEYNHSDKHLPVDERGTNFGDGVYEVVKIYNGKFYLLDEHIDRLYRSLKLIKIDFELNKEELISTLYELLSLNNFSEKSGHVYFQISRGSAPRGHLFPKDTKTNFFAYLVEAERPLNTIENGVKAILVNDIRWLHCDIKSLNLLPNILAKNEADSVGAYEAIQFRNGYVTEGSSSNIFAVHNGVIRTHPDCNLILPGIVKNRILKLCKENDIRVIENAFTTDFLLKADEVFLTSSTSEITPIVKIGDVSIGNGKPGELTKKIQRIYREDASLTK